MSPTTSYACSSNSYDVQSEKLLAREAKSSSSSCCPWALRHAPRTLTGSLRDQSARRGPAACMNCADDLGVVDPLQINRGHTEVGMPELSLDHVQRHALARHLDRVRVA